MNPPGFMPFGVSGFRATLHKKYFSKHFKMLTCKPFGCVNDFYLTSNNLVLPWWELISDGARALEARAKPG